MKQFIRDLRSDWHPFKYSAGPNKWQNKYISKRYIRMANQELVTFAHQLKTNVLFQLGAAITFIITGLITFCVPNELINDGLAQAVTLLFGMLTIFITAAIFLATLSSEAVSRTTSKHAQFVGSLIGHGNIFRDAYDYLPASLEPNLKWKIVTAYAAQSVHDQPSYEKFSDWLKLRKDDFAGSSYEHTSRATFDTAQGIIYSRAWIIKDAINFLENAIEPTPDMAEFLSKHSKPISDLKVAVTDFELTGLPNIYEQKPFIGVRLTRVTFYGLLAIVIIGIYRVALGLHFNLLKQENMHTYAIARFATILLTTATLVLYVRYLALFVGYLRNTGAQFTNYGSFYPRDPSETYHWQGGYGYMGSSMRGR